jgi:hypothetical protein
MTLHLERIAPQQVAESHLRPEYDEIPWRTSRNMLQDCLACRWGVSIVISVTISNLDYFQYLLSCSTSARRP